MPKVIIIGGGFAGLSAAARLSEHKKDIEILLIDKQARFNFLPMLPDVIGRGISPVFLTNAIERLIKNKKFIFLNDQVNAVSLQEKQVTSSSKVFNYDYLIIASGSETNFYGNNLIKQFAYKLDDAQDAKKITEALQTNLFEAFLVSGGGYTGIEVATNLRLYLNKKSQDKRVLIVERSPSILGPLPEWMKDYVRDNLQKLKIEVFCNTTIDSMAQSRIRLSTGESFDNTMLIWAAGVKTVDFIGNLKAEKNPQGRLMVDEYLRLDEHCFVAGDAAAVKYQEAFLRMAVQFSIMQGELTASNIINLTRGLPLKKYKPLDLGYVIPMANNKSCGRVFGINMTGFLPTILHYLMCIYRSYGLRNKLGIIKGMICGHERE